MFLEVGLVVSIPICGRGSSACQGTPLEKGQTFQCRILGGAHEPRGHWRLLLVSIKVVLGLKLHKTKMELLPLCQGFIPSVYSTFPGVQVSKALWYFWFGVETIWKMCHVSACPHLREGPSSPQEVCLGFQGKSSIYKAAFSDMGDFESVFLFTCIWVDFFFSQ